MSNKVSLNIKISIFIIIPIIIIILIFGVINTIYARNITKQMALFAISQMSAKEVYEIEGIINVELNYLNNIKYSVENLYNYDVRKREVYEDLMNRFAQEMSTNAVSVSLIFFTNAIDNDSMYINNPLYKNIDGRLAISLVKDMEKDNISLDNVIFYDDTNGYSVSLFNNKGDIIYCATDRYSVGENITNLSDVYGSSDLFETIYSNNTILKESYNKKNLSKYIHLFMPLHMFDDVYWGIELAVSAKAEFLTNYKIIIMMWIIILAIIVLIIIIVPSTINKHVVSAMNELNNNISKIKEGDVSWSVSENYLKLNDEIGDMSRGINDTVKYLNDLFNNVKRKINKVSTKSNDMSEILEQINEDNKDEAIKKSTDKDYKIVNQANETSKSLLEESSELEKIIEYFKLKK